MRLVKPGKDAQRVNSWLISESAQGRTVHTNPRLDQASMVSSAYARRDSIARSRIAPTCLSLIR
jgi:hypothetical protein